MSRVEKRGIIFDDEHSPESAYVLLSGIARITCRNRKGDRTLVIMVAPGHDSGHSLRRWPESVITSAARQSRNVGLELSTWRKFIEISLGISSADFKRMAASYSGRWDLVQLRCSNFMACTLEERVALILLELSENFGVRDTQGMRLTVAARHKDLAELVGASRPRVTEYLAHFERKRLIVRDGRQLIVRRDRLESFLAQRHLPANRRELAAAFAS